MNQNEKHGQKPHDIQTRPGCEDKEYLHRTAPFRQQFAEAFLNGDCPGVQDHYSPDAEVNDREGWVQDDDTVHRLAHWRHDAIY